VERFAVVVWAAVLGVVGIRVFFWPHVHSLYPVFATAARHWQNGQELYLPYFYQPGLDVFRYCPLFAGLFVPLAQLPEGLGNVCWRGLSAGCYLGALAWWSRSVLPRSLTDPQRGLLFFLAVPLSIGCVNNGQSNVLLIGLLLAGIAAAASERWNLAGSFMALAGLIKVYPLAIGLLLTAVHPRKFGGRFLLALAIAAALPFILQRPSYVAEQYKHWYELLVADDRADRPVSPWCSRDLWLLIRLSHLPISFLIYRGIQLGLAAAVALLCLAGRWSASPRRRFLTTAFGLGIGWMVLCGPATESCTYILMAPILAWAVLETWLEPRPLWSRVIPWCSFWLFAVSQVGSWFPDQVRIPFLGLLPLAGLTLFASIVETSIRQLFTGKGEERAAMPSLPAQAA
jgi:hypothetical protein